jgi:hypothetical protein
MFATLAPRVSALATKLMTPTLTLTVDKTVVAPGEKVVLSGSLNIPRECGDITRDNRVDIKDVAYVSKRFGTYVGHPLYDPIADLNGDGKIDIKDVAAVALFYGESSGDKPIIIYVSTDGTTWTELARVTTQGYPTNGVFTYEDTVPSDAPAPSTRYYMAYFPGGVF